MWFRIGIATGEIAESVCEGKQMLAGATISRAVRLEAAASVGEIICDISTFQMLSDEIQKTYNNEECVEGKRNETFTCRRVVIIPHAKLVAPNSKNTPAPINEAAIKLTKDKIAYLEENYAVASHPELKFDLKHKIAESKEFLEELLNNGSASR